MSSTAILKPLLVAAIVGVVALVSVWTAQPLLMPSLVAAVFVQVMTPHEPGARAWSITVGQLCGLAGGMVGVFAAHAYAVPLFTGGHPLADARAVAAVIAVLLTVVLELGLKAVSPAGGATAIVLAIGLETANWQGGARLAAGILIVTLLGEAARLCVLRVERRA